MPDKREWDGNEEVTITREELVNIVATRLAIEKKILVSSNLDKIISQLIYGAMENLCASICALIFKDITVDKIIERELGDVDEQEDDADVEV